MKTLWLLLPLSILWVGFYFMYQVMPDSPFGTWWSYPLLATFVGCLALSFIFALKKMFD